MKSLFIQAARSLTLKYLIIIMALSISFSFALYRVATHELGSGLRRQQNEFVQHFITRGGEELNYISGQQMQTVANRLKTNLLAFNLLVLVLGSLASYFLAKETLEPIEEAMEAQNRFTADASHELRTPLTALKTEIEVALRSKKLTNNEAREVLKSNLQEIALLEELSSGLLTLARLPDENITKSFQQLQVATLTKDAIEQVMPLAKLKNIKIAQQLNYKLFVKGDAISLKRVLVILLDNAIKFSPEKSTIHVAAYAANRHVYFEVKDQGIGISKEDQSHIFDRFYRVDQSRTKQKTNGYGLGLSIAKSIAELHQCQIEVKSQLGKGSTFRLKLPKEHQPTARRSYLVGKNSG